MIDNKTINCITLPLHKAYPASSVARCNLGKGINISHKLVFQFHLICSCEMVPCMKSV